ncbi:hypothetical protein MA16_Dca023027 [Dendrobium catenatum]|uniref:Uncharacterized protein n=1 Tax=Dendrobium catenatum TaxID=906689 RepID=A0A2I0WJ55_9ASPA|nr:hypothetical protein MA16_Dca023027 [Dendrobium catenatum]
MKALVSKNLLGHLNMDVKISIAYFLNEITRITTLDAPYDDDIMNEIFELIVGAFKSLDELSSRSFLKRVSIIEDIAKVLTCVLMLDIDCDDLILKMFQHFLKKIRSKHFDTIFSLMECIMTIILQEIESISTQLLSCLLDGVKVVEKKHMKGLDDTIVGSKIIIWWLDDQRFYDDIIDSFDQSTRTHKIV